MSVSKLSLAAVTAVLLAAPVLAAAADSPPAMGTMGGHGMMQGMFSQEERMMLAADGFKATAGMTDDQRHAYRADRRAKIMAMSDADRAKLKADLDTRWAALSDGQKADIKAKVDAFRAAHMGGGNGGGQ